MATYAPGSYFGVPKGGNMTTSKNGNPMLLVTVEITHRLDGGEWVQLENDIVRVAIFLTDKAWPTAQKKLQALGFGGNFDAPTFKPEGVQFVANRQGEYINWDLADWGGDNVKDSASPPQSEILKLNARWKQEVNRGTVPSTPPTPPVGQEKAQPANSDEEGGFPWEK